MFAKFLKFQGVIVVGAVLSLASNAYSWDHPGHMITANIAFTEIERERPELLEKIGQLFFAHPDPAPFWVAAGEAKGKERVKRMFIECARWADDSKFTNNDRLSWHTARLAIVAKDAPAEVKAAAAARGSRPAGQAIEALTLHYSMLSSPETDPKERALALCWVLHIAGDIHQPMHVSDLFTKDFPTGNAGATLSYVMDPVTKKPIPLHVLWDSNNLRVPSLQEVDKHTRAFMKKHPRSSFAELKPRPVSNLVAFQEWVKESHQVAIDWAYDLKTLPDPDKDQPTQKLVQNMINFILNGIAPVNEAPDLPPEYWDKLKSTSERRLTLAGYRIADIVLSAADNLEEQRKFMGR